MPNATDDDLRLLFLDARTHVAWRPEPVDDALLARVYELARMAPTAANTQPLRVLFVKSAEAKERLRPALDAGNVDKTMAAPVTAVIAFDEAFHEQMPKLFPGRDLKLGARPPEVRARMAENNAWLQAGYLILAARALGLDCGPMGGFDRAKVDEALLAGTGWRAVLLVNLGHGDPAKLHPRNPRLEAAEATRIA